MLKVKLPSIFLTFAIAIASCGASPSEVRSAKYLNIVVPPYPDSLTLDGQWLFERLVDGVITTKYAQPLSGALAVEKETGEHLLLVEKTVRRTKQRGYSKIIQVIPLGTLSEGDLVMTGLFFNCGIAGRFDPSLVLLGKSPPVAHPYIREFRRGWKVNYETQRLDEISVNEADYRCENVAHTL